MTTSVLLSHVGELNGHDLLILKDFAIEAPEPWRNAIDRLVEATVNEEASEKRAEAAEESFKDAKQTMEETALKMKKTLEKLRRTFEQAVITESALASFEGEMSELIKELEPG